MTDWCDCGGGPDDDHAECVEAIRAEHGISAVDHERRAMARAGWLLGLDEEHGK